MSKEATSVSSMRTVRTFLKVGTCSEALCNVLNRAFNDPLPHEEHAAMPLAGGIMQHGYQCGLLWGAALAAGAQAYRLHGPGPQAETVAIVAAQRLVDSFRSRNIHINCLELTDTQWQEAMQVVRYFIKGGTIRCLRMAGRYSVAAFTELNTVLSEKPLEPPSGPVSCAAVVAKKMGVSDLHAVMAAGFAGGIGLCGGACGALGAAIWARGINSSKDATEKLAFHNPKAEGVVERFLKCTDYSFECSEIVGRKFEDVHDHAEYVRNGGCSELIDELAAE